MLTSYSSKPNKQVSLEPLLKLMVTKQRIKKCKPLIKCPQMYKTSNIFCRSGQLPRKWTTNRGTCAFSDTMTSGSLCNTGNRYKLKRSQCNPPSRGPSSLFCQQMFRVTSKSIWCNWAWVSCSWMGYEEVSPSFIWQNVSAGNRPKVNQKCVCQESDTNHTKTPVFINGNTTIWLHFQVY